MTLGERGGSTRDLDSGIALIEQHKASLAQSIREDILSFLEQYGQWHRNNLRVDVPADSKNAVGAVVSGLISSGAIVETGERRKSADPASHGRKSNVFKLRQSAKSGGPCKTQPVTECSRALGAAVESSVTGRDMEPGFSPPEGAPDQAQQDTEPVGRVSSALPTDPLPAFDGSQVEHESASVAVKCGSYYAAEAELEWEAA